MDYAFHNATYTIRQNPGYTRPGYTFDGWNTNANGTGVNYAAGQTVLIACTLNLYAKWKVCPTNQFTITYLPNGGTGSAIILPVNANTNYTIVTQGYSRDRHNFDCWNTRADGTGIDYRVGQNIYVTGSLSLYAKWEPWI
jgi:uncharacterized repeat protein (TIGR02543 family)